MLTFTTIALLLAVPGVQAPSSQQTPMPVTPGAPANDTTTRSSSEASDKPVSPRPDLLRFASRLEQRVSQVSRSAQPVMFLAGLPETRAAYLPGFGAIFLMAPRALSQVGVGQPTVASAAPARREGEVIVLRPKAAAPPAVAIAATPASTAAVAKPADLEALEEGIREARRESEMLRARAEAAFAEAERQFMGSLQGNAESRDVTELGTRAPWLFMIGDTEDEDARTPEQTEKEVRETLITGLLEDHGLVRGLGPDESITVSVDLVMRRQPWAPALPTRTLVVRAKKVDLDARSSGKITRDELLKKVDLIVY